MLLIEEIVALGKKRSSITDWEGHQYSQLFFHFSVIGLIDFPGLISHISAKLVDASLGT
jgi:hypothetical protein